MSKAKIKDIQKIRDLYRSGMRILDIVKATGYCVRTIKVYATTADEQERLFVQGASRDKAKKMYREAVDMATIVAKIGVSEKRILDIMHNGDHNKRRLMQKAILNRINADKGEEIRFTFMDKLHASFLANRRNNRLNQEVQNG